jgi:hypothetical protein
MLIGWLFGLLFQLHLGHALLPSASPPRHRVLSQLLQRGACWKEGDVLEVHLFAHCTLFGLFSQTFQLISFIQFCALVSVSGVLLLHTTTPHGLAQNLQSTFSTQISSECWSTLMLFVCIIWTITHFSGLAPLSPYVSYFWVVTLLGSLPNPASVPVSYAVR